MVAIIVPKFGGTYQLRGLITGGGGGGVAFDAISNLATPVTNSSATLTWTHTPVGVPTAVAVLVGGYLGNTIFTTVTYGGAAMTAGTLYGVIGNTFCQIWFLANPSSGPQTVSMSGETSIYAAAAAITVTGSDTTTCFRNASGGTGTESGAGSSVSVTSASGDLVIDCVNGFNRSSAPAGPSGTSQYTTTWNGNLGFGVATTPGAASVAATWTNPDDGVGQNWAGAIASFKAP